jgi:4-amino-4-deoxy-L-arabinose transferase-like glycosyltransferase
MCAGVQEAVTEPPPPATWPEFWRDLAVRVAGRARRAGRGGAGEPAWARPAALLIATVAALSYAWAAVQPVNIEIYYAAAVRSMTTSPSNFFFGAFDPAGLMTTDKLPGAFWLQAISAGIFGPHNWALVLPQVIEGAVTVLVLYRVTGRTAGPVAGLIAAGVLALSPATVALNRGNISDTLMILLAVLAASAVCTAASSGRLRPLLLAGVWVGLAFQAKMLEAWLLLPALALCYLVAAPGGWWQRARRCAAMTGLAVAVSLSWMSLVTIWPASARPYLDGSTDNSAFQQVFVYNGFGRLDQSTPDQLVNKTIRLGLPISPKPSWDRLLTGEFGRATAWLFVVAVVVLAAGLIARRGQPRTDPVRAALLLWGGWLIVLAAAFSAATTINTYYTAALSPALAALTGIGLVLAWRHRDRAVVLAFAAVAAAGTAGYAAWLLPDRGTGLPGWLRPAVLVLAVLTVAGLAAALGWRARRRTATGLAAAGLVAALATVLAVPAVAAATVVGSRLGPFQTPFEPARENADTIRFLGTAFQIGPQLAVIERATAAEPYLMATQTAVLAAPFIWASGREVVPVGGFTGAMPSPTLAQLKQLIASGHVSLFLQSPATTDPRLVWVTRNCLDVSKHTKDTRPRLALVAYFCGR